jgi:hypothetical protein
VPNDCADAMNCAHLGWTYVVDPISGYDIQYDENDFSYVTAAVVAVVAVAEAAAEAAAEEAG